MGQLLLLSLAIKHKKNTLLYCSRIQYDRTTFNKIHAYYIAIKNITDQRRNLYIVLNQANANVQLAEDV